MEEPNVFAAPKTVDPSARVAGGPVWAGFWRRGAAYFLDYGVLLIPGLGIEFLLRGQEWVAFLAQVLLWWLYKAGLESSERQATLGKRALGVKVVGGSGERISFGRATGRHFAGLLSSLLLGIGLLMAGFTQKKQALHDWIATTYVVRADAQPDELEGERATMPITAGVWVGIVLFMLVPFFGIFAAIAIPAYQDYVVRVKMTEALADGARLKPEALASWAQQPTPEGNVRFVTPASTLVKSHAIDARTRTITTTLNGSQFGVSSIEPSAQIVYTLQGQEWACTTAGIPMKYLPAACRR
jgi:uncharacterized RDD family membrane protein YckC/Tfp pilus assembly major pilin PilA